MWPRFLELGLAAWLLSSPWTFGHFGQVPALWLTDLAAGLALGLFAALSIVRFRLLHVANIPLGLALAAHGYLGGQFDDPGYQNQQAVGLLLLIVAILPSPSRAPPERWRRFELERLEAPDAAARGDARRGGGGGSPS